MNDIWTVNPTRAADPMTEKMRASFKRRVEKGEKYPLLYAIHETYFFEFWLGGCLQLMATIFQVMSPFLLRYLIQFANDAYVANEAGLPPPHIGAGIGLVFGVTIMQILQSLGTNHFIYRGMMVGGETRAALISLVFEKSLSISGRARAGGTKELAPSSPAEEGEGKDKKGKKKKDKKDGKGPVVTGDGTGWQNGKIVNLMSVDTYRVDQASALFHLSWTAPITCIITLVVLLINLTYSALAGFGLLVIGIPLLTRAIRSLFVRRKAINKITDQRVSLTQEILQSVRFVKYFGWESAFLNRLEQIRNREIHSIQVLLTIRNAINAVSLSLPIFASMLSFIAYSLSNHELRPAEVFSSLALFNGLRIPLNLLPLVLGQVVDAWSSLKRIQEFLLAEEQAEDTVWKPESEHAMEMHDANFTWERTPTQDPETTVAGGDNKKSKKKPNQPKVGPTSEARPGSPAGSSGDKASTLVEEREPFKLENLNFQVGRKELIAVIGTVGSGKSSLLAALAGDMRKTSGELVLGASRAFCPQYAWIQNTTVKENILFGKEMDRKWYKKVIHA
jgi:ATP-binding cassette, subfamily C (CFTR/MRP), member 1